VRTIDRVRIISLLPSATEIVFALGRGDDLVGVTFECDHPPEARRRRVVSTSALPEGLTPAEIDREVSARVAAGEDLYHLDQQALAELDADVVLTQDLCAVCAVDLDRVDDALAYLGCTAEVVTLDPHRLDDVIATFATVGAAIDRSERAQELVDARHARLDALRAALEGRARPDLLVLEWTDPPFTAGHWVPDLVTAGGGTAALGTPGGDSRRIAWGDVHEAPADVVLVAPCGYHLDGAADLAAQLVDAGRLPAGVPVWAVDADSCFVRPGPRIVDAAETVASILHAEVVGSPRPDAARRIA
jgi:iron complex transport system substrate-binding protein